jgi:diguanylate cyclase (GGDEF)-like protein
MRIVKSLLPILVLLVLSLFAYRSYPQLSPVLLAAIVFLPVLLSIVALGLSVYFSRSHVFFYVLLIMAVNVILGLELAGSRTAYSLMSGFVPLLLVSLSLLPDRGLLTMRSMPSHLLIVTVLLFSLLMVRMEPQWLSSILFTEWLPARYFDWTGQSQTVLFISVVSVLVMMITYAVRPSTSNVAGLGILIVLIVQMHFGATDASLHVFSITALLMSLYAILQESWRMAYIDELTELPARRALRERLQKVGGIYTVAMLDVDHFKRFNDTYGHDTGDAVLRMIAARMRKVTGGGTPYRYGGEEFTVVFSGKDSEDATAHLEGLRELIADTAFVVNRRSRRNSDNTSKLSAGRKKPNGSKTVQVTVSIGVADSAQDGGTPWEVVKRADKALYRAKQKGRNRVSN